MKHNPLKPLLTALVLALALAPLPAPAQSTSTTLPSTATPVPADSLRGLRATYDNAPRLPSGRVDIPRLLSELSELRVNTYNWLVWHKPTDWDDLQAFLPLARARGILVWVTLVPPSEAPPRTRAYSEPFRLDYARWAEEIARLSAREPNLVAWSVDDYCTNLKTFTPELMRAIRAKTRELSPRLAFVPCCYFRRITPAFAREYGSLIDGVLFPYRAESAPKPNLTDPARVADEIRRIRATLGRPGLPVILDIYATRHSTLGDTTPDYVRQVMLNGRDAADGVMIYCHQDKQRAAAKYNAIKAVFNAWAAAPAPAASASASTTSSSSAAPAFRVFNIRDFGAAGDGKTLDTAAINKAIDACAAAGGGRVFFPAGDYLSGTVLPKSNMELYLDSGARLIGTPDLTQYKQFSPPSVAPESSFGKWHRALILASGVKNLSLSGGGVIDGAKVFDPTGEEKMRGPHAILLGDCQGVLIQNLTIRDAANYATMIEFCDNVAVRGVSFTGGWDGVHFRGWKDKPCHNIIVLDCRFATGDDSIAGRYAENVVVERCSINSSCNGMRIIGPMKSLIVRNCSFFGPGLQPHRSSRNGRNNMLSGIILQPGAWDACEGPLQDVLITSISMRAVASPVTIFAKRPGNPIDRIAIDHLTASGVYRAPFSVESWSPDSPIGSVTLRDAKIEYDGGAPAEQARLVPKVPGVDCRPLPAWGLYLRNAGRIHFENVTLGCARPDLRPAIKTDGAQQLELKNVQFPQFPGAPNPLALSRATLGWLDNPQQKLKF